MSAAIQIDKDCADYLFCGLPYLVPVISMIWKTHWIPAPAPYLANPVKVQFAKRIKTDIGEKFEIIVHGPSHMGVMISPVNTVELYDWNLESRPLVTATPWQDRKTYFIFFAYGQSPVPFNLTLHFKIPKTYNGPVFDFAVTSHYFFGPSKSTLLFRNFVKQFPSWTVVSYWTATYESWVL